MSTKDSHSLSPTPSPKKQKLSRHGYIYDGQNRVTKWPEESVATGIPVSTRHIVLSVMEQYKADPGRIDKEWMDITGNTAPKAAILPKQLKLSVNGYQYYMCKKMSQITLHDPKRNTRDNYDFVNASYIYDSNPKQPVYIASQSPMPSTLIQFWSMLWECNVSTVVMLSVTRDKSEVKGCRYWPKEYVATFGQFEVCVVSKHAVNSHYIVRSFYVKDRASGCSRTITQFQYKSWDEESHIPRDMASFLEFRRKVQRSSVYVSTPIVIHCRDGLGRSGLFILLDLALRKLMRDRHKIKELDLCALLEFLRDQRPGSVTSKEQYQFCIGAFSEEVYDMLSDPNPSTATTDQQLRKKLQQDLLR